MLSLDRILPKEHIHPVWTTRLRRNQRGIRRLGAARQSVRLQSHTEQDGQPQVQLVPTVQALVPMVEALPVVH